VLASICIGSILLVSLIVAIVRTGFSSSASTGDNGYPIAPLGQALLGDYLVPFELASVILLVVMIGAAYLAKRRQQEGD
jgi:NADH-quinone oxidoreductase subunit J